VAKSTDGGASFQEVYNFGHPVVWLEIDQNDPSTIYASVVHSIEGGIYWSQNGGASWTKLPNPPRTQGHPYNIISLADGSLVASYAARADANGALTESSGVFILPPGSSIWQDRTAAAMRYFTKDLIVDPHDPAQNTWYATVWGRFSTFADPNDPNAGNGGLYRSIDRGQNWTRIFTDKQTESLTIHPSKPGTAYLALENNGLFFTENLGASPDFDRVDSYPFWRPKRVFFKPGNDCEVWVTSMGGGLWKGSTSNGGALSAAFNFSTTGLTASFSNISANATSFSWNFGDGSPASTEANPIHEFSAPGNYTVVLTATNDCGSQTFEQQVLVDCPAISVSISAAGATSFCTGETVLLSATAGFPFYQWHINGVPQPVSTGSNFQAAQTGNYSVVATDATGCTGSSTAVSIVENPLAAPAFNFSTTGLTTSFSNISANATSFSWNFGDGSPASTEANPIHEFSAPGNYTVVLTATNDCGSQTFAQQVLVDCPAISVSISAAGATSFCTGETVLLSATAGFPFYQWHINGVPQPVSTGSNFQAAQAGNYSVVATDATGCTGSSTAVSIVENPLAAPAFNFSTTGLTASFSNISANATSFSWNFGDGSPASTEANPIHEFSAPGNYSIVLTATNDCGSQTFAQQVLVDCPAISVSISAAGATQICMGDATVLNVGMGSFSTFQWYKNGAAIAGATGANFAATESGVYQIYATDMTGCGNFSNEITIEVNLTPTAEVTSSTPDGEVCAGEATWLHGSGGIDYQWFTPDGLSISGQEIHFPIAQPSHSGVYYLTVTDGAGCSAAANFLLTVHPTPQVSISGLASEYTDNDPAVVLVGSPSGGAFSGAGVTGDLFDPAAAGAGQHQILYTFTDTNGCVGTAVAAVTVSPFVSNVEPGGVFDVRILPNPNAGFFTLKINSSENKFLKINILNAIGQVLESRFEQLQTGTTVLVFEQAGLSPGVYFLEILNERRRITRKFIVLR
jgi:PKD repeat protein